MSNNNNENKPYISKENGIDYDILMTYVNEKYTGEPKEDEASPKNIYKNNIFKPYIKEDGSIDYDRLEKYVNEVYTGQPKESDICETQEKYEWKCRPFYDTFKICRCKVKVYDEYDIDNDYYIICNNVYRTDNERHAGNYSWLYDKDKKKCIPYTNGWYVFDPDTMICVSPLGVCYCLLCCSCMCCCCGWME